jgi:Tol biopolymer transport system component
MGTAAYMSPEQARSEKLDARTDLFSFGAVLYEMATRQAAFSGDTAAVVFDAILNRAPTSPIQLNPEVPPRLEEIINKALEKDREIRYQHASDLCADLKRLKRDTDSARATSTPPAVGAVREPPLRNRWALALASVLVLAIVVLTVAWFVTHQAPSAPPELQVRRLTANPSENPVSKGTISPDGKYLAYGDRAGLHLKLIHTGETIDIPQPEGLARQAETWWPNGWFPDSTKFLAVGFDPEDHASAWVISVLGGPPRKLRDDARPYAVSPDGTLIAFQTRDTDQCIWLMGAQGEEPRRLVTRAEDEELFWAAWSPDGRRVAYYRWRQLPNKVESSIESRDLRGGPPTVIASGLGSYPPPFVWFQSGRLVYALEEHEADRGWANLWDVRVDASTSLPVGKPNRITNWAEGLLTDISGSPNGKELAVTKSYDQNHVYIAELEARGRRLKNLRRLTLEETDDLPGGWMPDSKAVLFWSNRNATWGIYRQRLDQTTAQPIVTGPDYKNWPVVSPDGSWILYLSSADDNRGPTTPVRIMRAPTSGGAPQLVSEGRGIDRLACAAPPAAWCVFSEPSSDQEQVVFAAFDPVKGRGQELSKVSLRQEPSWIRVSDSYSWDLSRDGSHLAFAQRDQNQGRIEVLSLAGGESREVNLKGRDNLYGLNWAADGGGLFVPEGGGIDVYGVSGSAALLYVDLEGRAHVIRPQNPLISGFGWAIPSPDGRYLAMLGGTRYSNVWLLENF